MLKIKQFSALALLLVLSVNFCQAEIAGKPSEASIVEHFKTMSDKGLDMTEAYNWELRFTGVVLSPLEAFSQVANLAGYWPVALETDKSGSKYWLYIQKTTVHSAATFNEELNFVFEIADKHGLSTFDGFSISPAQHRSKTAKPAEKAQEI